MTIPDALTESIVLDDELMQDFACESRCDQSQRLDNIQWTFFVSYQTLFLDPSTIVAHFQNQIDNCVECDIVWVFCCYLRACRGA